VGKRRKSSTALAFLGAAILCLPLTGLPLSAQESSITRDSGQVLTFETIASGLESGYPCRTPTLLVIRDLEDWHSVWRLHQGRGASQHQLPDIDFERYSVIALFAGRSTLTEGIEIVRLEQGKEGATTVCAVALEPGQGCPIPQAFKNPFHMVRVPVAKRYTTPSLEIELLSRHCADDLKKLR
jgi:hypothetical protein